MGNAFIRGFLLLVLLQSLLPRAESAEWVPVTGKVMFGGTPLCAMVLANGQNMFSCSGDGSFTLSVPLDGNGEITVMTFAQGFAPFRQTLSAAQVANITVNMERESEGRPLVVVHSVQASTRVRWTVINGTIEYNGTPVCALILANGKHMFSCNTDLGQFSLEVPIDSSGNVTLFAFVSGFQPYKVIVPIPGNNINILGEYTGSYTIEVDNCLDPESNGIYDFSINISIDYQNDNSFSGTAIGTTSFLGESFSENLSFSGVITKTGVISGETTHTFLDTGGVGTFSGGLSGNTLSIVNTGHDTYGDVCTYTRVITAVR
jgi:hypothetical protein